MTQTDATLLAALVAALLSAVTLSATVVIEVFRLRHSRDEETTKWVRSTLHQVALDFIRTAWTVSGLSGEARRMRLAGSTLEATQPLLDQVHDAHTLMQDLLTSLRLLAPTQLVETAFAIDDSHHGIINAAFGLKPPHEPDALWEDLRGQALKDRLRFIDQARAPLRLDVSVIISGGDAWSSWTVPADVRRPGITTR